MLTIKIKGLEEIKMEYYYVEMYDTGIKISEKEHSFYENEWGECYTGHPNCQKTSIECLDKHRTITVPMTSIEYIEEE